MKEDIDGFYLGHDEPLRSVFLVLRDMILAYDENISETIKYGMPCFLYKRNIMCYLWWDRKSGEPYILFAEGNYLEHPRLEKGNRSRMKVLKFDPDADIPVDIVNDILGMAISLYTNGTVKLK